MDIEKDSINTICKEVLSKEVLNMQFAFRNLITKCVTCDKMDNTRLIDIEYKINQEFIALKRLLE